MIDDKRIKAERITDERGRGAILEVLSATYQNEKRWIVDPAAQFPSADIQRPDIAWFMVRLDGQPVGVLRTLYDPSIRQYANYSLKPIGRLVWLYLVVNRHVELLLRIVRRGQATAWGCRLRGS